MWIHDGDTNKLGNAGGGFGKRSLFLFTIGYPEIRLPGARVFDG